ncbi:uncharacterized protein LOC128881189 [Hylaeus volcanicus]|uniref:uncharacterized protein LOC128881189 n=1 Tax=Hylaeus volcanicus TaxID=313075 RepID=UPI0023B863DA|nr:uncharacterized protein LOC128881189 [Hylaeus volcanicus]
MSNGAVSRSSKCNRGRVNSRNDWEFHASMADARARLRFEEPIQNGCPAARMRAGYVWLFGIAAAVCAVQGQIQPSSMMHFDREATPTGRDWSWQNEGAQPTDNTGDRGVSELNENIENVDDKSKEQRSAEAVIEEILVSNRQGRNIEGYDQVYADPNVKNALQLGNDTIARSYIRDKLCSLGLMNCENLEGRRPYYSPHRGIYPQDIIYAQPVTIKPVGRPLPAIPVKRPYGSSKPLQHPLSPPGGFASSGPPPEVIYGIGGSPHPPSISQFGPPSGLIGSYPGLKRPGPPSSSFIGSKPVYEVGSASDSFLYEGNDRFIDKKQIALRPSVLGSDSVQQHVHHHYHHGEGGQTGGPSPSVGYGQSYGSAGTTYDLPAGGYQDFDDYKKAFKVKVPTNKDGNGLSGFASTSNYADRYPVYEKPTLELNFGKTESQKTGKYYSPGGNYLSPNTVPGTNDYSLGSASTTSNNYFSQNLYENDNNDFGNDFSTSYATDCVCVPYEQCPSGEHAGRKDDLFLPIDPRNLNKNIEAETIETGVEGNGTLSTKDSEGGSTTSETPSDSARTKREAGSDDSEARKRTNGEGRLDASDLDSSKLNVKPTWGISFGLPQTGGPYPIGQYGGNALVNPYGGYGSSEQGLNFGLVSVNPLLAVQFTKDEYGDKVVKPFVNFHVTPNRGLVQKLNNLLAHKKQALYESYGPNYAPHYYPSKPSLLYEKPYYANSHHPPPYRYPSHRETPYTDYSDYYRDGDDYDYDYEDQPSQYYARSNVDKSQRAGGRGRAVPKAGTAGKVSFPNRRKRDALSHPVEPHSRIQLTKDTLERQFVSGAPRQCGPGLVCCSRRQQAKPRPGQCGTRYTQGINGRIKTPAHIDGDAEFGEYPWQVAILKKDPTESVYVCGGTLISSKHILTAAHCVKTYAARDLRVRLGEWDVNHDVEFYPYIERDVASLHVHPEFYAGTLYNDIAILRIDHQVDFQKNPHVSPACLPDKRDDFARSRCWTTGWGKDAFGDFGKYQNILKEVDVPVVSNQVCEHQMRRTRLGPGFNLHPGFICAGGEEGKDACKGDGGGPMVCERHGRWQLAGIVSWGIGCGQPGVPGVYSRVSYYLDWIQQIVNRY